MNDINGRITSRQVIDASLYIIAALLGLLWVGMRSQVDRAEATGNANTVEITEVRASSKAFQSEVLRRLDQIAEDIKELKR